MLRSKTIVETDPVLREAETESDCLADRATALDEQKVNTNCTNICMYRNKVYIISMALFQNGAEAWYVPECTPDGRYQRIQCYRSVKQQIGYCWCVHEDTGKNIAGTSVKDGRPDCAVNNVVRPMKGCPEPRKVEFLKELKEFLRTQIASNANSG